MLKKQIWAMVIALGLIFTLASCAEKCDGHVDKDDDYLCDKCGDNFDDGDEVVIPETTAVKVEFTVSLDNGAPVSGLKFTLDGVKSYELTSGADGRISLDIEPGYYTVSYDYDTVAEFCTPSVYDIQVTADTTAVDILIVDNTPDGSFEKPFYISENETEITLDPGEELFFNYRGSMEKYVRVHNPSAVVYCGDQVGEAIDGVTDLLIQPADFGRVTVFSVKNTSDEAFTALMELVAPLGSYENPIDLTDNSATVTVMPEQTVYYDWVAPTDGVLLLVSPTARNNIILTKVLENYVTILSSTEGEAGAYMYVKAGQVINIGVSALLPTADDIKENPDVVDAPLDVEFTLKVYSGVGDDVAPMIRQTLDISLEPSSSASFLTNGWGGMVIEDGENISVEYNGVTYTADEDGRISVDFLADGGKLTLTNLSDEGIRGAYIKLTPPAAE